MPVTPMKPLLFILLLLIAAPAQAQYRKIWVSVGEWPWPNGQKQVLPHVYSTRPPRPHVLEPGYLRHCSRPPEKAYVVETYLPDVLAWHRCPNHSDFQGMFYEYVYFMEYEVEIDGKWETVYGYYGYEENAKRAYHRDPRKTRNIHTGSRPLWPWEPEDEPPTQL